MKTDRIDLFYQHRVDPDVALTGEELARIATSLDGITLVGERYAASQQRMINR